MIPPLDSGLEEGLKVDALARVVREGVAECRQAEIDQGLNRLMTRMGAQRRRRIVAWSLLGASASLCAILGVTLTSSRPKLVAAPEPVALSYQIEGGTILEGGYLREAGHAGIKVSFNEGSRLVLPSGTRGRLRSVDKQGARVAIEQGMASFEVVQGGGRRWLIEAGPFFVTVKGTAFTVGWDASTERFELALRRGQVVVSGPISGGDVTLRAGQRLVVNLQKAETVISDEKLDDFSALSPADKAIPDGVARPESASVGRSIRVKPGLSTTGGSATAPVSGTTSDSPKHWADALARGHWNRILDSVERDGLTSALDNASSEDLIALANVARYRHRLALARAALLTQRQRFPHSPRANDALFLLGRVEELDENGTSQAIAWYDQYLEHVPAGTFSAEALGRKMTLTSEAQGPNAARSVAEEYLRRFPRGSYAGSARALHDAP